MSGGTIHDDLPPIETNLTYGESLADHLLFQLHMVKSGDDERRAAEVEFFHALRDHVDQDRGILDDQRCLFY